MTINSNQFALEPVQGEVDMTVQGQVVSAQVYASESANLVAGQAVKLRDDASGIPTVTACTANTDLVFGFVVRNPKDIDYAPGDRLEVALAGALVYMTAGAAIARGAAVEQVFSTKKVITSAGLNPTVGMAFDKAAADGDLIRVLIDTPLFGSVPGAVRSALVVATLAEINAGKVIVPGVPGKKLRILDITERVAGAFAATTSVDLQAETTGTKVSVALVAALTNGAVLKPGDSNVSRGAGYGAELPTGEGLVVANVGSAATTGTSITYTVQYAIV